MLPLDEGHDCLHSTRIHLLRTTRAAVLTQGEGVERFCENFVKPRFPRSKLIITLCPAPPEPHAASSLDGGFRSDLGACLTPVRSPGADPLRLLSPDPAGKGET